MEAHVRNQLSIQGTESEDHAEINEAAEELRRAKADAKRAQQRVANAQAVLISKMEAHETVVYEYTTESKRFRLDLSLPEPTVKLSFVGDES